MALKIEVGKTYVLKRGEIVTCVYDTGFGSGDRYVFVELTESGTINDCLHCSGDEVQREHTPPIECWVNVYSDRAGNESVSTVCWTSKLEAERAAQFRDPGGQLRFSENYVRTIHLKEVH